MLTSSDSTGNDLSTLSGIAKSRILNDMIETVKVKTQAAASTLSSETTDLEKGIDAAESDSNNGTGNANQASSDKQYIALIVDSHTLRIVSGACRQYDIQERGVSVVEQIEKPRQPLADMDAIYFLTPTEQSVEALIRDHRSGISLYRFSHVFFSGPLGDKLFDLLAKEESLVNKCYSFYELNMDFVCFEPRVFYCDMPLTIRNLRGTDANVMMSIIRRHVDCLTSVCASLGERPVIRYMGRSTVSNLSEKISLGFKREIDLLAARMEKLRKPFKTNNTTFLVVDRSVESAGLLVHDFFYQSLVLDILDGAEPFGVHWSLGVPKEDDKKITTTGVAKFNAMSVLPTYDFSLVNGKGEIEEKHAVLSEQDDLWVKFRHAHVKDVSETTAREVREFGKTHNLAKLQKEGAANVPARRASQMDPMELLRALPEYQDILGKYSVHIEISKQCFDLIESLKLMEVAKIEQELATGVDDEGKDVSCIKLFQSLTTLLQSGKLGQEEKLRLVALYLSQVNDVNESSAQTLVRTAAGLSPEYEQVVKLFLSLGVHGTRTALPAGISSRHSHKLASDKGLIKKNKARAKASELVNCRYVPKLADLVESLLNNQLDFAEFPSIGGTSSVINTTASTYSSDASPGGSKRSAATVWGGDSVNEPNAASSKPKLVVFVIGGVTLAELRAMDVLEKQFGCEIFVGGSTILTPKRLVEILLHVS